MARKRKKETYRERWLREHPRISLYLSRDEYEALKRVADSQKTSMKEVVLNTIHGFSRYYEFAYADGFRDALKLFHSNPYKFYMKLVAEYPGAEEVALFTAPCLICGKPVVFTHRDREWAEMIRPILYQAFGKWYHICCREVEEGKRKSCIHLPKGL
jgi:hypothetical protein